MLQDHLQPVRTPLPQPGLSLASAFENTSTQEARRKVDLRASPWLVIAGDDRRAWRSGSDPLRSECRKRITYTSISLGGTLSMALWPRSEGPSFGARTWVAYVRTHALRTGCPGNGRNSFAPSPLAIALPRPAGLGQTARGRLPGARRRSQDRSPLRHALEGGVGHRAGPAPFHNTLREFLAKSMLQLF